MKNLTKLIPGLMLLSLPLTSHATKTILCGQFKYKPQKTVTVLYYATPIDNIEHSQTRIEGDVDANGNFKLELNIDHTTRINVMHGNEWLFYNKLIGPGDSLRFEFDSTSTVIKGPGENGIGSMFLYEAGITEQHVDQNKISYQTTNEVEFAKYWEGQVDSETAFYDNYFAKNPVSPEYAATAGWSGKEIPFFDRLPLRDSIARKYLTGKVYDVELYDILYDGVKEVNRAKGRPQFDTAYEQAAAAINILGKGFQDKSLAVRISKKLEATREEGKLAYDFSGVTLEGKKVWLSDFRGKVVYVDFWESHCVPCMLELPHIKRLQKRYKGEEIVFLYYSLDNSMEALKSFVRKRGFKGLHINDPKGLASDVAMKYHISGIPRHIIVDKKGFLVSSDAPRPGSYPEEILDKLLGKNSD